MLPYLSALENAMVFKGTLQMFGFTLLYFTRGTSSTDSEIKAIISFASSLMQVLVLVL